MISNYRFGHVDIDGREYTNDVIVHGDSVESWWRAKGHSVAKEDIEGAMARNPGHIVIGTGAMGLMKVPDDTREFVEAKGISLFVARTSKAIEEYNRMVEAGNDVALAIHLTC